MALHVALCCAPAAVPSPPNRGLQTFNRSLYLISCASGEARGGKELQTANRGSSLC